MKEDQQLPVKTYKIRENIDARLSVAMLNKDRDIVGALRMVKTEITAKEKETGQPADDATLRILFRQMVKSRNKANDVFMSSDREDLAFQNNFEIAIMSQYLPVQMSQDDMVSALQAIAKSNNMYTKADFGKVMKLFGEAYPDEDKGMASQLLKNILA